MRRLPLTPALLSAAAAALVLAACGPGARLAADSPGQAVSAALEAVWTTPLVMSFQGSLSLDTAGLKDVPSSLQPALGKLGGGGSASGRLTQASSSRREVTLTAAGQSYTFVEYDGHGYVRQGTGGFAELSTPLPSGTAPSAATISAAVAALDFRDEGSAIVSGQRTEHYHAAVSGASLEKLVQALPAGSGSSSQLQQIVPLLIPFVSVRGAAADIWVSQATGGLVRAKVGGTFSLDIGKIASSFAGLVSPGAFGASLPSGTLSGTLSLGAEVTQYGGSVALTKPVATATLPAGGGASGMSGGIIGIPWAA